MHIVHVNANDRDSQNENDDDLAVLGVFFQIAEEQSLTSETADEAFDKLTRLFDKVQYAGAITC